VSRTIRAGIGEATATRRHPAPKTISHSFGFRPGIDLDKGGSGAPARANTPVNDLDDDIPF
jgi:hypothetical protein